MGPDCMQKGVEKQPPSCFQDRRRRVAALAPQPMKRAGAKEHDEVQGDVAEGPSTTKVAVRPKRSSGDQALSSARLVLLLAVGAWQMYTSGRLSVYGNHLLASRERHEELQTALEHAQAALSQLRNSTQAALVASDAAAERVAAAEKERKAVQFKLEEVLELNSWLNETAGARETSLRAEQAQRLSLEGSVQSLKEQMSLMQGQLVTAQQQQGTLHSGRRKGGGKH